MEPEGNFRRTSTVGNDEEDMESSECSERHRECCPPQLFTSILLGLLACVLVTGGVFLAFHKWDHTWLLVSAVGILLMAIGTALHCCSSPPSQKSHRCKGGCTRPKPDGVGAGVGTMLSEQLLPLSNARSVSQLSLNMVPGYFPPLVYPTGGPYGLEQHSAVVRNISKLVQHQQQLHLQSPTSSQPDSKSFILLPLPVDANAANIQNIVAAVCQLDASTSESTNDAQTTDVSSQATETSVLSRENSVPGTSVVQPSTSSPPVLKHAEVQTCCDWVQQTANELKQPNSSRCAANVLEESTNGESSTSSSCQTDEVPLQRTTDVEVAVSIDEEVVQHQETVEHVGSASNSNCDTVNLLLSDIPSASDIPMESPPQVLSDLSSGEPQTAIEDNHTPLHSVVIETQEVEENLIDIEPHDAENQVVISVVDDEGDRVIVGEISLSDASVRNEPSLLLSPPGEAGTSSHENLADIPSDLESELFDRSSPPPSYEDVTQGTPANASLNGFGLAYGTM